MRDRGYKDQDITTDKEQTAFVVNDRGGFKPGPWPPEGPPDLVDHPMPGRIPVGWPNGEPVITLTHPKKESDSK